MLKKTVTFKNIDGDEVSKDLYFNISANELVEREAQTEKEGLKYSDKLKQIGASNKVSEIYPVVLEFMEFGYGIRTPEGDFEKDPTGVAWTKFKNSLAFDALMEELLFDPATNGNNLATFITGMLPEKLAAQVKEQQAVPGFRPGADTSRPVPPAAREQLESGAVETPAEPVVVSPAEPVQPIPAEAVVEQVAQEPDAGIQHISEPREPDLPGTVQQ